MAMHIYQKGYSCHNYSSGEYTICSKSCEIIYFFYAPMQIWLAIAFQISSQLQHKEILYDIHKLVLNELSSVSLSSLSLVLVGAAVRSA